MKRAVTKMNTGICCAVTLNLSSSGRIFRRYVFRGFNVNQTPKCWLYQWIVANMVIFFFLLKNRLVALTSLDLLSCFYWWHIQKTRACIFHFIQVGLTFLLQWVLQLNPAKVYDQQLILPLGWGEVRWILNVQISCI